MKLESIPVQVTADTTGMANAILTEIATLLERLAETEVVGAIDLRSLPMSEADKTQLEERLGRGEVSVQVDVAGLSEVWETSYAGVWWVRHRGSDDRIVAEQIAVTQIPGIVVSPLPDVRVASAKIMAELKSEASHG